MPKPPKVVLMQEPKHRLIAQDEKCHRILLSIGTLQYRHLLAQSKNLQRQVRSTNEEDSNGRDQVKQEPEHT